MANDTVLPGTGETIRGIQKGTPKAQVFILDRGGSGTEDIAALGDVTNGIDVDVTRVQGTVAVTQSGTWDEVGINDSGNSITVDSPVGTPTFVRLSDGAAAVAPALEAGGNLAAILAAVAIMDDWDETDRAKVNIIAGQVGVAGGAGASSALTLRVVPANDVSALTGSPTLANGQVAPTTSAATLVAARTGRRRLILQNRGTVTVFVGIATVTTANGFEMLPGSGLTLKTSALVQAITPSGTGAMAYIEEYG